MVPRQTFATRSYDLPALSCTHIQKGFLSYDLYGEYGHEVFSFVREATDELFGTAHFAHASSISAFP